jgi:hypothetical protein
MEGKNCTRERGSERGEGEVKKEGGGEGREGGEGEDALCSSMHLGVKLNLFWIIVSSVSKEPCPHFSLGALVEFRSFKKH